VGFGRRMVGISDWGWRCRICNHVLNSSFCRSDASRHCVTCFRKSRTASRSCCCQYIALLAQHCVHYSSKSRIRHGLVLATI
jgi:hypothetical protein